MCFLVFLFFYRICIQSHLCICLGANEFGQLGDGTEEGRKHPEKVKQLQSEFVKSVSCGAHCTAAIAGPHENDGTISTSRLWVWGQNQVVKFILLNHYVFSIFLYNNVGWKILVIVQLLLLILWLKGWCKGRKYM